MKQSGPLRQEKKAVETILQTKRVENFLSPKDKVKLFADIKKYKSGTIGGSQQTMKIADFAKYFPEGYSPPMIGRQINRIAREQGLEFKKLTKPEELAKRRGMEAIKRKGDPTWITKTEGVRGTIEMPLHHMRAKSISPTLANITYTDVATNSIKLRPYEYLRNSLLNEQRKVFRGKKSGWEKELEKLNFKARKYSNDIPRDLKGLLYFEQMDKAGNLKAIGGNPMKSIAKLAPEGDIAFNTLTRDNPLRQTIVDFAKSFNEGSVKEQRLTAVALNCGKAEGGRIGYALGTATINCVNQKLTNEPVQSSMRLRATEGIGKIRGAATNFLKLLGRGGVKAAPYAALATVGAGIEPLVKQFRNDDPSTYLTDESQMKGMLLATIEGETPKVDEEILKWQYPALGAATAAGAIPGAGEVYKARRGLPPTKDFIGPMRKGVGPTRAALGITGVLGKALGATFSPLAVLATLPVHVAAQRAGGTDYGDIATDPMNWMQAAFASSGAEMATRGMKDSSRIANAIRLGFSPRTLSMFTRRFGLPGLAVSAGLWGYDKWKNRSINDPDE